MQKKTHIKVLPHDSKTTSAVSLWGNQNVSKVLLHNKANSEVFFLLIFHLFVDSWTDKIRDIPNSSIPDPQCSSPGGSWRARPWQWGCSQSAPWFSAAFPLPSWASSHQPRYPCHRRSPAGSVCASCPPHAHHHPGWRRRPLSASCAWRWWDPSRSLFPRRPWSVGLGVGQGQCCRWIRWDCSRHQLLQDEKKQMSMRGGRKTLRKTPLKDNPVTILSNHSCDLFKTAWRGELGKNQLSCRHALRKRKNQGQTKMYC